MTQKLETKVNDRTEFSMMIDPSKVMEYSSFSSHLQTMAMSQLFKEAACAGTNDDVSASQRTIFSQIDNIESEIVANDDGVGLSTAKSNLKSVITSIYENHEGAGRKRKKRVQ